MLVQDRGAPHEGQNLLLDVKDAPHFPQNILEGGGVVVDDVGGDCGWAALGAGGGTAGTYC